MAVAIIGAGLAGLTCAERLAAKGVDVAVFDKGRGPGGRMSTRRAETSIGQVRFDHGAQFISPASADFAQQLETWATAGFLAPWNGRFVTVAEDGAVSTTNNAPRWVGKPAMNALIRALSDPFDVNWATRIESITGSAGAWNLNTQERAASFGPFEKVLLAIPAEQVGALLDEVATNLSKGANGVVSVPSWTAMLAFDTAIGCDFDAAKIAAMTLGWAARNNSKPDRGPHEAWVVQASADWSAAHLEDEPDTVANALFQAFRALTGAPTPVHAAVHRWRYSQAEKPLGFSHQYDPGLGLGTCGDWHLGGKCEDAWKSGRALADTLFDTQPQ
ncbi:MAG: FAD-dependent oxidoreductase [Pseudomonadota bacterium]